MPALYTPEEILTITEGRIALGMMHETAGEICIDTRELQEGQWFLALPGKNYDGHDFIGDAYSRGALGCIVEERANYPIAGTSFPILAVEDTAEALKTLARNWRKRVAPRIVTVPFDAAPLQKVTEKIRDDLEEQVADSFLFLQHTSPYLTFAEILSMPDDVKFILSRYQFQSLEELQEYGWVMLPHAILLSDETCSGFRLQIDDADFSDLPFGMMPSLRMNQGTVLIESTFANDHLPDLAKRFADNVVLFDWQESESKIISAVMRAWRLN